MRPERKRQYYLVIAFNENDEVLEYHEQYATSPEHAKELARGVHHCEIPGVKIGSVKAFPFPHLR